MNSSVPNLPKPVKAARQSKPLTSIKAQILLAFTILVLPVIGLMLAYLQLQSSLPSILSQQQDITATTALALRLERDVIDLQRNVLIFKETGNTTSADKASHLFGDINSRVKKLLSTMDKSSDKAPIHRMQEHLREYNDNFTTVIEIRKNRDQLIQRHLESKVQLSNVKEKVIKDLEIRGPLKTAKNMSLQYLINKRTENIDTFKSKLDEVRALISQSDTNQSDKTQILDKLNAYEKNFLSIRSFTRSYVYLINVVMAGSAHEVLYLSNNIVEQLKTTQTKHHASLIENSKKQLHYSLITISIFALLISVIVTYFFKKITRPIAQMTDVFIALSDGQEIDDIPGQERADEIGDMAIAANVFRENNAKTVHLLSETQKLLDQQDILNNSLNLEKKRVENALSTRTEFMANMSHELRTPLNSVIGYTARLLKSSNQYDDRHNDAIKTIQRNGKHLLVMINDILDISKMEADKLEVSPEPSNLSKLCDDCVGQLRQQAEDKNLTLITEYSDNMELVNTDPTRFSQVVINLLSNAIKYTDEGWVKVRICAADNPNSVLFEVSDSGIGIAKHDMKNVFNRFAQFDVSSKSKIGHGTGLGLAIVANITRLLGGEITAKSHPGEGSCFSLTLPIKFHKAP